MDNIEGHPIPQDITGFQFRIIGDLTIKQFAYLGLSLLCGWIFLSIPLPLIIKIPLIVIVVGTGIVFAFIPILGRPADTMLLLFLKAVFNANEYTYQKQQPHTIQAGLPPPLPTHQAAPPFPQAPLGAVSPSDGLPQENTPPARSPEVHEKVTSLEQELESTKQEKQRLEEQLLHLQQQLQQKPQQVFTPTLQQSDHVKTIPDDQKKTSGAPLAPDAPNLILGIVKDPRGNSLPNILIEVKDHDGHPVRAFKTNPLGQFASATPLLNGTYTISFEDPKNQQQFDTIEITANGDILAPLEVTSVDERENLRKSLFGG